MEGSWAVIRRSIMKCILGLSTLALLLLAGTSSAQEPAAGATSAPVVQQGTYVPASTGSYRRFGRWRGTNYSDSGGRFFRPPSSSNKANLVSPGTAATNPPPIHTAYRP